MWKVQLFKLNFDQREAQAAKEVVESGWLTMGERIAEFESNFSKFLGSGTHCTAVANGTAALHMALLALDVKPEDEVIIPALTFVADANVVRMVGANPVLADCTSLENWNMSADTIAAKITPKTKAVIIVHYAGFPCDMVSISALCRAQGIKLIEDVAHAPGASWNGQSCGTFGDISCFSFFSNKNLSMGEGGMVASCDEKLSQRLRFLRSHGMTTLTLDRHKGRAITYDVVEPGLNYRMDEIRAAIGLVQLEKLPAANLRRAELTQRYRAGFSKSDVLIPFSEQSKSAVSAYHILPVLLPIDLDRVKVIEALKTLKIQSSIHYPPFWSFTAYSEVFSAKDAPTVAEICNRQLTLPLYPTMTNDELDLVVSSLLEVIVEQRA
jgi:dTDP-4-amino-4,6-dideoxygalactose transaminase